MPRTTSVVALLLLLTWPPARASEADPSATATIPSLPFPPRAAHAPAGSELVRRLADLVPAERQRALVAELEDGNVPAFLRRLRPVELRGTAPGGRTVRATVFVLPDYLAVGTDHDFVYVPLAWAAATEVAGHYGCILPTPKMVDAIYAQAAHHLPPVPLPAGPLMRSIPYLLVHQARIDAQRRDFALGDLIAGHKKDVVLTRLLLEHAGRIAIYGWHRAVGQPIQPLSTVHGEAYADYSHALRLVSDVVVVDGHARSVYDALEDPTVAQVLNGEGVIPGVRALMRAPQMVLSHPLVDSIGP